MDYKTLNLKASSSPHIRSNEDVRSIMLDVLIAFLIYKPLSPLLHR